MATYVNDLRLKEIATGDESGTWGTSTNTNLELIAEAFSFGTEAITTNADTHTTTIADGSTDPGRSIYLKYTGTLDSACTITIGPNTVSKLWFIENGTSGSQNIIISQGSGANVTVPAGEVKAIYSDGAGSGAAMVDAFANLKVSDAAQTNITSLGTLTTLTIDDITIDGSTISDAGNMDFDIGGDLTIDVDGADIKFADGGTEFADHFKDGNDYKIQTTISNGDFIIVGNDGGSAINAFTLDMSDAGAATFNSSITVANTISISSSNTSAFIQASDNVFQFGTSSDDPVVFFENNAEKMRLTSGNLFIGTTDSTTVGSPDTNLIIGSTTNNQEVALTLNVMESSNNRRCKFFLDDNAGNFGLSNTASSGVCNFVIEQGGIEVFNIDQSGFASITHSATAHTNGLNIINSQAGGYGSALKFQSERSDNNAIVTAARIRTEGADSWNTDASTDSTFKIETVTNNSLTEKLRITTDGQILANPLGVTVPTFSFIGDSNTGMTRPTGDTLQFVTGGSERNRIDSSGNIFWGTTATPDGTSNGGTALINDSAGRMNLYIATTTTGAADIANFFNGNGLVGRILTSGSSTTYQTSSDYRLKENVNYDFNGLERLKKLKPARFNFIADADTTVDGFLAHEVEDIVPEAVGGKKDGEEMQSMDYGRITPLLVKAIQEQQEQIDALQSEINILKGE